MTWIKTVAYKDAQGSLRKLYDRIKGRDSNVDNIMLAHSLRPHTMEGHMTLYKTVLHHPRNSVAPWFLEAIGVFTSLLNDCHYCVEHHTTGMTRLVGNAARAREIRQALQAGEWADTFSCREKAALDYARKLTEQPCRISRDDVQSLLDTGWQDGEILEINQVTAYFNYANRTVLGLGVTTAGDILGLSPNDSVNSGNWQHR